MKANEFVKKFGWDLVRRDVAAWESGFIKKEDFTEHFGFDLLDDLERLVESYELVEKHGGLEKAKLKVTKLLGLGLITQAEQLHGCITDVESCQ